MILHHQWCFVDIEVRGVLKLYDVIVKNRDVNIARILPMLVSVPFEAKQLA